MVCRDSGQSDMKMQIFLNLAAQCISYKDFDLTENLTRLSEVISNEVFMQN